MQENRIKKIRTSMKLSQSQFATRFNIPVKTLQGWERGTSNPAPYLIELIEKDLGINSDIIVIPGNNKRDNTLYKYDKNKHIVYDKYGKFISLEIDMEATSMNNLGLYLDFLFEDIYKEIDSFTERVAIDKRSEHKIEWERMW